MSNFHNGLHWKISPMIKLENSDFMETSSTGTTDYTTEICITRNSVAYREIGGFLGKNSDVILLVYSIYHVSNLFLDGTNSV
jgi:hypothetical protein